MPQQVGRRHGVTAGSAKEKASAFVRDEQQFHLGFLPTEQAHPVTTHLSSVISSDLCAGIDKILSVDEDVVAKAAKALPSPEVALLVDAMAAALEQGGRVIFSGCGATGRLSILLEAAWKRFWQDHATTLGLPDTGIYAGIEDRVLSVMTGGDRALIRSEENFEDFQSFGHHQMSELNVGTKDTVVAISEGGETSSVIGTALHGADQGCRVFFVFNNPAELLAKHIARSRDLIHNQAVTAIDLSTGPMAVTGSTRMQATTIELLVLGATMERVLERLLRNILTADQMEVIGLPLEGDPVVSFAELVHDLRQEVSLRALGSLVELEYDAYLQQGRVTYFAHQYMLDVLTDTTERAPTFTLPPFRSQQDLAAKPSWAFLKHPYLSTRAAWKHALRREPRGLAWTADVYRRLGGPRSACVSPPRLDNDAIHAFQIGCEDDPSRYDTSRSVAIAVLAGDEVASGPQSAARFFAGFAACSRPFSYRAAIVVGPSPQDSPAGESIHVPCRIRRSPIHLWEHLAVKLVMNTLSTATMARMGRVRGNWMIYAEATNKKLIDRASRTVQSFTGADYLAACEAVYEVLEVRHRIGPSLASPAVMAIERLRDRQVGRLSERPMESVPV